MLSLRDSGAGTVQVPQIRFNNDSGNNYSGQTFVAAGSGSGGAGLTPVLAEGVSASRIGRAPAASAVANSFSQIVVDIYDYTSVLKLKTFTSQCASKEAASSGMQNESNIGVWSSLAALTRLDVYPSALFLAGSRATLYGIGATNLASALGQILGQEVAYAEITTGVVSSTPEATATTVVTAPAFTADGVSEYMIEFYTPAALGGTAGNGYGYSLFDGATNIGVICQWHEPGGGYWVPSPHPVRRLVPTAGSHTYSIRQWSASSNRCRQTLDLVEQQPPQFQHSFVLLR